MWLVSFSDCLNHSCINLTERKISFLMRRPWCSPFRKGFLLVFNRSRYLSSYSEAVHLPDLVIINHK